jgi:hypothetical protein
MNKKIRIGFVIIFIATVVCTNWISLTWRGPIVINTTINVTFPGYDDSEIKVMHFYLSNSGPQYTLVKHYDLVLNESIKLIAVTVAQCVGGMDTKWEWIITVNDTELFHGAISGETPYNYVILPGYILISDGSRMIIYGYYQQSGVGGGNLLLYYREVV